jgi:hypothetical protein
MIKADAANLTGELSMDRQDRPGAGEMTPEHITMQACHGGSR